MPTEKQFEQFRADILPDLIELIKQTIPEIEDEYKENDDDVAHIYITIATNEKLSDWAFQTGDNSFSGSCYHYPKWGVGYITIDCNPVKLADELIDDMFNQFQ